MALTVESQDNKFRVKTQVFETDWLPDTSENRKVVVVMLRVLKDESGKPLLTLEELAAVIGSDNRQAAGNHVEKFRECGENFEEFLKRKRKVDEEVVKAAQEVLQKDPLQKAEDIAREINERLGREDISAANVEAALEQISCREIRKILKKQLAQGEAHYKEDYLLKRLFEIALATTAESEGAAGLPERIKELFNNASEVTNCNEQDSPQADAMELPKNVKPLFEGEVNREKLLSIWDSVLGWKLLAFILYFHGVSQATIGGWMGVNKSTICRWLSEVAGWATPYLEGLKVSFSGRAGVDEKMVKIGNCWWYLFVAVDCVTGCPLHLALYPSNNGDYCKLFLLELKNLGYFPKAIITDGWDAYIKAIAAVFPNAEHLLCRFHVIKSVFRRLQKAKMFSSDIWQAVGKLFKTHYKRTVLKATRWTQSDVGACRSNPSYLGRFGGKIAAGSQGRR